MSRYPETINFLGLALKHVLSEQATLLGRSDLSDLVTLLTPLNKLATSTAAFLAEGRLDKRNAAQLTREAEQVENAADHLSEQLWRPIQISVRAIYERIANSLKPRQGYEGFVADIRTHYHNLRIRLLDQLLGARMLSSNSDLGDEIERIWQQFLERSLGPSFRILRGGHICDHQGNRSNQLDLILVPSDAQVFFPGDSVGGKAHVFIDHVISVIMITSTLSKEKLRQDWASLQSIPAYPAFAADYAQLKGHPWPLTYIVGTQSDGAEALQDGWISMCDEFNSIIPQFVIGLDTCFLFSGLKRWPAPSIPLDKTAKDVSAWEGKYAGLGLAWLILQNQGRLAVIHGRRLGQIDRFAKVLDSALCNDDGVPTWSARFNPRIFCRPIGKKFCWGSLCCWPHNRILLSSIAFGATDEEKSNLERGTAEKPQDLIRTTQDFRCFRFDQYFQFEGFIAFEEWLNYKKKADCRQRIVVFKEDSGEEIDVPVFRDLTSVSELPQALLAAGLISPKTHTVDPTEPVSGSTQPPEAGSAS